MLARSTRAAARDGGLALASAVSSYYLLIVMAGVRPGAGTAAVLAEAAAWLGAALLGGPLLGASGWYACRGSARDRSLAWGVLGGLLASQGLSGLTRTWSWATDLPPGQALQAASPYLVVAVLPVAGVLWATRRARPAVALVALAVTASLGSVAWGLFVAVLTAPR